MTPDDQTVRAAVARILAAKPFNSRPRLSAFLRFVVGSALNGNAGSLKAYNVAVGALGRRNDFDPVVDSVVRVEAGRVRSALADYYAHAGADDPVLVEMPRGTYVPRFDWRNRDSAPKRSRSVALSHRENHAEIECADARPASSLIVAGRTRLSLHAEMLRTNALIAESHRHVAYASSTLAELDSVVERCRVLRAETRALLDRCRTGR
jgi:hypothetical protein